MEKPLEQPGPTRCCLGREAAFPLGGRIAGMISNLRRVEVRRSTDPLIERKADRQKGGRRGCRRRGGRCSADGGGWLRSKP